MKLKLFTLILCLLTLSACSEVGNQSSTIQCQLGSLNLLSGNNQQGVVGQGLSSPVVVHVQDSCGQPVSGIPVYLSGSEGFTSDSKGNVSIPITLPTTPGSFSSVISSPQISNTLTVRLLVINSKCIRI